MRIVLFTMEETQFTPLLLEPVLQAFGRDIVAAYLSRKSLLISKHLWKRAGFVARNLYPFCIRPGDLLRYAQRARPVISSSVRDMLRSRGIPADYLAEIRSPSARQRIAAHRPDLILFCPFDKIAGPKFLAIPRLGTFNTHLGKLPEQRGALGPFWALRFGEREAGASFHRATAEVDAGEIIAEARFPIRTLSMWDLTVETVRAAGPMVVEGLARLQSGNFAPVDVAGRAVAYRMLPTRQDLREFYLRGCTLV